MLSPLAVVAMMYRGQLGVNSAEEVCLLPEACTSAGSVSPLLVLLSTGILTFLVVAAIIHLRDARAVCEQERSRSRAERDAFAQFNRRLAKIEVSPTPAMVSASVPLGSVDSPPDDRQLEQVRDAYRETVMSVSHYEDDYGESLAENMREEFGDEIATAVTDGSGLSSQLKGALVQKCEESLRGREEFIARLDQELKALDEADDTFFQIDQKVHEENERPLTDRSFGELAALWDQLESFESRCRRLMKSRQEENAGGVSIGPREFSSFHAYLYRSIGVTHPILSEGAALIGRLRTARRRVLLALTRRV